MQEIVLAPLMPDDLERLLAEALAQRVGIARGRLAELVFEKTDGNPFFAIQFFMALAEEALLAFDPGTEAWTWDLPRIRAKGFTDNVADLMAAKLSRLPHATQEALGQLACLGNVAELATLALVQGETEEATHAALWEAVRAGLVLRQDSTYTFLHDRIQEAAYALIAEGERAMAHLRIGRLLAAQTPPEELEDSIFDIVNQFDRGAALITDAGGTRAGRRAQPHGGQACHSGGCLCRCPAVFCRRSRLADRKWLGTVLPTHLRPRAQLGRVRVSDRGVGVGGRTALGAVTTRPDHR